MIWLDCVWKDKRKSVKTLLMKRKEKQQSKSYQKILLKKVEGWDLKVLSWNNRLSWMKLIYKSN